METNIVKETCKELGVTQKELAKDIGVAENTLGQWARGVVPTPKWAYRLFDLLKTEKKFNQLQAIFEQNN
jgi:DNA-binding XRE family transcriptional regulator